MCRGAVIFDLKSKNIFIFEIVYPGTYMVNKTNSFIGMISQKN